MSNTNTLPLAALAKKVGDDRPATLAAQAQSALSLLADPKAPSAKRADIDPDLDALLHDPSYGELLKFCALVMGAPEMEGINGKKWKWRCWNYPRVIAELLHDVRLLQIEGRGPKNTAAYCQTCWDTVQKAGLGKRAEHTQKDLPPKMTQKQQSDFWLAMADAVEHPEQWTDPTGNGLGRERWKAQVAELRSEMASRGDAP